MNNAIFAYETNNVLPNANLSEFDSARLFTPETLGFFKEVKGREVVFLDDNTMMMIAPDGITYFKDPGNSTTVMVSPEDTIVVKGNNMMEAVAAAENYIKRVKG